jgi:hypothetical protein
MPIFFPIPLTPDSRLDFPALIDMKVPERWRQAVDAGRLGGQGPTDTRYHLISSLLSVTAMAQLFATLQPFSTVIGLCLRQSASIGHDWDRLGENV